MTLLVVRNHNFCFNMAEKLSGPIGKMHHQGPKKLFYHPQTYYTANQTVLNNILALFPYNKM